MMLLLPGSYDSRKTAVAWGRYHEAPSASTFKELQAAKRSDRWTILVCELVLGGVRVLPVAALIRMERKTS